MSARAIVYNFISEQAEIIQNLVRDGEMEIIEWFCHPPFGSVPIRSFADVKYGLDDSFGLGEQIYEKIYQYLPVFLDMHQRRFPYFQNTLYDLVGDFNRQFGVVYRLLESTQPDLVLFGNIPHGGHDFLLYRVARAMGIRTLVLFQIPVCPRFMILEDIDDFGQFSKKMTGTTDEIGILPEIRKPFYMRRKAPSLRRVYRFLKPLVDPGTTLPYLRKSIRYMKYRVSHSAAIQRIQEFGLYAYFPLHLQPEMTTSSLGGMYVDQMLAIERLARKMPSGSRVVVKENPKQNEYQRPASFYERLAAIPNVVLVPTKIDTFDLIKRSLFVATVTGTAGWEAVNLGKPALVFGKAWYERLPGVFKYKPDIDLDKVIGFKSDQAVLERMYQELLSHSWPGIISSPYFALTPGLDIHANNQKVADAIRSAIGSNG